MKITDLTAAEVTRRLRRVAELRRFCRALAAMKPRIDGNRGLAGSTNFRNSSELLGNYAKHL